MEILKSVTNHDFARLRSLAYRMLGSAGDAEDMVQEALLRLHQVSPQPDSPAAFLYRTVSNLCIDKLRHARVERAHYQGPWLPEPFIEPDPDVVEQAQQLNMGFMLMLEILSPAERIVYVLREAFDFSFPEIAKLLDIDAATARQRAHRARTRLGATDRLTNTTPSVQRALLNELTTRLAAGDVQGLIALLAEDAVVYTDGGGVVSAAIIPITGRERIVQVTLHLLQKAIAAGGLESRLEPMNGGIGLVLRQHGAVYACLMVDGTEHQVHNVYVIRNPRKLTGLAPT